MDSALYCNVGDVIGHSRTDKRWEVVRTTDDGVTLRRIMDNGKLAQWPVPVEHHTLRSMVIHKHAGSGETMTVSSLDYMSDDNLSDEDKVIIWEALSCSV